MTEQSNGGTSPGTGRRQPRKAGSASSQGVDPRPDDQWGRPSSAEAGSARHARGSNRGGSTGARDGHDPRPGARAPRGRASRGAETAPLRRHHRSGTPSRPADELLDGSAKQSEKAGREHPKVRTEHGTRVARSITCVRCGADDTLHFIPRHEARALCRKCAAATLDVADTDAGILPPNSEERPGNDEPHGPPPPSQRRATTQGVIRVRKRPDDEP